MPYQSQHLYVAENATPRQEGRTDGFHGTSLLQRHSSLSLDPRRFRPAVSPSAISRQIAKLEHELRAPIFDRRAQGMKLTAAGEILLSKIDGVMSEFSRVKSHIAALQDLKAGNVDVCCFQTAIESFVAPVLNRFHTQYPEVTFNIRMSSTDEAMEALIAGTAEISLVLNAPARNVITSLEVFRDRMVAVFSPAHPLARRKTISLRDLEGFSFALTEPSFGLRQQMDRVFARHGFRPTSFCVTNSLALVKELASTGRQCTLLPRFVVQQELAAGSLKTAAVREFASEPLVFCICSRSDRSLSPAAKVLMDTVADYCRRYR